MAFKQKQIKTAIFFQDLPCAQETLYFFLLQSRFTMKELKTNNKKDVLSEKWQFKNSTTLNL